MSIDFRDLQRFVVLAEELHFTRAASRLHMAQPALTSQINRLETSLGVKLFTRTTRSVALTRDGELFLAKVLVATRAYDDALATADALMRGTAGEITLGMIDRFPSRVRMGILSQLANRAPDLTLGFSTATNVRLIEKVVKGELDLALCHGPVPVDSLQSYLVATDRAVAVMPTNHRLAEATEVSLQDLRDEVMILQSPRSYDGRFIEDWYLRAGISRKVAEVNVDYDEFHSAVLQGYGIEVIPEMFTRPLDVSGLAFVPISPSGIMSASVLLIHRKEDSTAAFTTVRESVAAYFGRRTTVAPARQFAVQHRSNRGESS